MSFGSVFDTVPLVVRNNTCTPVAHVEVTGTARSATGALVASVTSQGIEPATLGPGEVGIGHLYLGSQVQLPAGVQFSLTAAGQKSLGVLKDYLAGLKITDLTAQQGSSGLGPTVTGIAQNPRSAAVTGPFGVDVVCFDQASNSLGEAEGFANQAGNSLPAGGTTSFTVQLDTPTCPVFLAGGSGFDQRELGTSVTS